jgi:hypothetical protein
MHGATIKILKNHFTRFKPCTFIHEDGRTDRNM